MKVIVYLFDADGDDTEIELNENVLDKINDSFESFQQLNEHFESAVDSIESSRDTVLSLFDLYTTKSSHRMNNAMRRLTFITLTAGGLGVIAGIFGMNFEVEFFKSAETGFWITIGGMAILAVITASGAFYRRWI